MTEVIPGDHPGADRHRDPRGKDDLLGLKENIVIGHLIPAGSGIYRYAEIDIEPPEGYEAPPPRVEEPVPQPLTAAAMLAEEE